jgi:adenine-specific DNA methylase
MTDRRFIEESFPVKEVGEASSREKNIRHGHISTLHIWWARRPLAASRATAYAALTPAPKDIEEWDRQRKFIIDLCQWENSNNQVLLERARKAILEAHAARLSEETGKTVTVEDIQAGRAPRPRVLDPFAGGGSYPLEALRLGCESYANDYNPVAVLIEKATLEYPQKFGRPFDGMPEWAKPSPPSPSPKVGRGARGEGKQPALFNPQTGSGTTDFNPLLNAVRYWGEWVQEEARKQLAEFYPPDPDGSIPVGYIWARIIPCQNPACGQEIPLMRAFWLSRKDKRKIAIYPEVKQKKIEFCIVGDGYKAFPDGFDPEVGTISRAVARCLICGTVVDDNTTRRLFQQGKSSQKLIVVVLSKGKGETKRYRVASRNDIGVIGKIEERYRSIKDGLFAEWGFEPIPDEVLPIMSGVFNAPIYGLDTWGKLYNMRQALAIIELVIQIRRAYEVMINTCTSSEFPKVVITYLALVLSRHSSYNANLCWWEPIGERSFNVFGRQALPMVFDFSEQNPFGYLTGNWASQVEITIAIIDYLTKTSFTPSQTVTQSSATGLLYADSYFDVVLTDPPYYNSVPYADLSDFFYVWLKRTIGFLYPDLFSTPLTPKDKEITEMAGWDPRRYADKDKGFFEENLKQAFWEIHRVLKPGGISVIVYAHKSTEGWETVINALLDSGLVVTSAWPINTEMQSRLRANDSATLASSIYVVVRKTTRQPTGFYNDVRAELRQHLDAKLERLWEEGIGGADFFIAAIGSAIEVFGKYEQVMDYEGNIVRADRLLEEVRTIATDYAVRQILHDGFATEISGLTRFYVLWRWNYCEAKVPFDEARKLAQSCGIDLSQEWNKKGAISKEKEFVRLLGPQQRKLDDLDDPRDLIDVLHKTLLLWEKSQRIEMIQTLSESGHGQSEAFYRVAQAISETLPLESKEKKLLDGFLAGRERVQEEVEKAAEQGRLFE